MFAILLLQLASNSNSIKFIFTKEKFQKIQSFTGKTTSNCNYVNTIQEKNNEDEKHITRNPKDELISKFTTDVKNFYGFNEDPKRFLQLSKHDKTQPKTAIHFKASIDKKEKVDDYYLCNVNYTQTDLNKSCYKFKYMTTKEDYANILDTQIKQKAHKIEVERLRDKMYMKVQVNKEKEAMLTEREEKVKYLERIRNEFKEKNKSLLSIRKAIEKSYKEQEMIDNNLRMKNIQKEEIKRINNESYRKYHNVENLDTHLLKQLGAKNIEKRRNKHSMRSSST